MLPHSSAAVYVLVTTNGPSAAQKLKLIGSGLSETEIMLNISGNDIKVPVALEPMVSPLLPVKLIFPFAKNTIVICIGGPAGQEPAVKNWR